MNQITLENLQAYAGKLNARIDYQRLSAQSAFSVYLPQTKTQEKNGQQADFLCLTENRLEDNIMTAYQFMKNWETLNTLRQEITKKDIEQFIRNKIKTDYRWALRTLIIMFEHQTADEQRKEETREHNHVGFTGFDGRLMTSIAKQYLSRAKSHEDYNVNLLSRKQMQILHEAMPKYWKQVFHNCDELKLLQQIAKSKPVIQMAMTLYERNFMDSCKRCGSFAINPNLHGRDDTDLDLCDVCYWRKRAEEAAKIIQSLDERLEDKFKSLIQSFEERLDDNMPDSMI
jgi:hypothetical protein